jgi:hypothetical protein
MVQQAGLGVPGTENAEHEHGAAAHQAQPGGEHHDEAPGATPAPTPAATPPQGN